MKSNKTFATLSFFGIIMVVSGHCSAILNLFNDFYPYNSFFMPLFMFISGYFFKDKNIENKRNIFSYIKKKIINLLVYYFLWNIFYGLFMLSLHKFNLFTYRLEFNIKTIFIYPFFHGQQFWINAPAWFIPTLFMVEIVFLIIRKIQTLIKKDTQYLSLLILFIIAVLSVYFSQNNNSLILLPLKKIGFFLFFFQLGKIYKEKLENKEKYISTLYVIFSTLLINITCMYLFTDINFPALYDMTGFKPNPPIIPIITSISGIWFWLRLSKIISPIISNNKLFNEISNNTKSIMMHHMFFMTAINILFYYTRNIFNFSDFNVIEFKNNPVWYHYFGSSTQLFGMIYILVGLFAPLIISKLENKIKQTILRAKTNKQLIK